MTNGRSGLAAEPSMDSFSGTPSEAEAQSWQRSLRRPIPALDGVRGLAILAVLAHQLILDRGNLGTPVRLLLTLPQAGWIGVQLFFVLSGFLITGILLDTRSARNRWSSFFMRRALRIFPPYYLLLAVLFVLLPAFVHLPSDFSAAPAQQSWYWFYAVNWSWIRGVEGVSALGHCWSLSVEEQFYLLWPPIIFALRRSTVAWLCVALATVALGIRIWIVGSGKDSGLAYALTVARMDALAIGALTAILVRRWQTVSTLLPRLHRAGWLILAALVVSGLTSGGFALRNPRTLTLGHTIWALSSAWLILTVVRDNHAGRGRIGRVLAWYPLRLFGKHSYAVYLFHHPIDMAINRLFLGRAVAGLTSWQYLGVQIVYWIVGSLGLLALAMIFHVAIERPILSFKRHFEADRRPLLGQ